VLRRWHWQRLWRLTQPAVAPRPPRPGDAAVTGSALYVAALEAGDEVGSAQGLRLLISAAEQGIGASGITSEGSSARQRQLADCYAAAWLAARRRQRPEQWRLAAITRALLAALAAITLPGGLPAVGEAVPPPAPAPVAADEQAALDEMMRHAQLVDLELLRQDGWLRLDRGAWSGLWLCPSAGWPSQGGLAHSDLGAAELHWQGQPLFVDPGSPPAGQPALTALYRSATGHGGLTLDGHAPYPLDRPFYSAAFRSSVAGPPPELRTSADGVKLNMDGFTRLGGHRHVERHWRLGEADLILDDLVLGTGRPRLERRLFTPWLVSGDGAGLLLIAGQSRFRLSGEVSARVEPALRWRPDGTELPLTRITFSQTVNLPWRGQLRLLPA
jgi:hypothetical protein